MKLLYKVLIGVGVAVVAVAAALFHLLKKLFLLTNQIRPEKYMK